MLARPSCSERLCSSLRQALLSQRSSDRRFCCFAARHSCTKDMSASHKRATHIFDADCELAQEAELKPQDFLAQHPDSIYTTACLHDGNVVDFQLHLSRLSRCAATIIVLCKSFRL